MEDGNYFGDNQLLGLASILQQLHVWKEALIGGMGVCWVGGWGGSGAGAHISGFNKNAKILYFVTKLLQGKQIVHKSVTDFPEICWDFHAEEREFGDQRHLGFCWAQKRAWSWRQWLVPAVAPGPVLTHARSHVCRVALQDSQERPLSPVPQSALWGC